MNLSKLLQLAFVSLISLSAHAGVLPQTFLSFSSDPGDSIGLGQTYFFTPADGNLVVNVAPSPTQHINFFFDPGLGLPWSGGDFSSDGLGTPLAVGQYDNAQWNGSSVAGHPGLNLYVQNHFSNNTAGSFHIYDLTFDAIGLVNSLAVTFDQYSNGNSAALHGALWVNSSASVPAAYAVPEPATTMLMLTGLGLLGFAIRRPG